MKKLLSAVILTILFTACKTSGQQISQNQGNFIFDTITQVYKADFTTTWSSGQDIICYNDQTWMPYSFCKTGLLIFRNIDTDSLIALNLLNSQCDKIYTTMNAKGIYVVNEGGDVLHFANGNYIPSRLLNLQKDIPEFARSGMIPEWYKPGSDQHYNTPEDVIYFRVDQNSDVADGVYSKYTLGYPVSAKLNLKSQTIEFFGKTPKYVTHGEYGLYSEIFDLYIGDSIVYSRPVDGKITLINTLTREEYTIDRPSTFQTQSVKKFKVSRKMNMSEIRQAKWDHALLSASYEPLFFNPNDKCYYRIFHPQLEKMNENGLLNSESDKRSILMIFDQELKLIEEIEIPLHGTNFLKIFPFKNGVGISLKGELRQEGEYIKLPIFRIRRRN